MRNDLKDRKDPRVTKYTYLYLLIAVFDIVSNWKIAGDFLTFNNLFTLLIVMKTKKKPLCNTHILKKKDLNLYKIIILIQKLFFLHNK